MNCATPVALFVFNRPEPTRRVFQAIRQAQPPKLFVVGDGPRNAVEAPKCQAARAVAEQVDWKCQVLTNFADTNLGCGHRVASGLDWVFGQVPEAIILEDDCLPAPSFFPFCDELLARYREDPRVMHIAGSSFLPRDCRCPHSYYFSKYALIWGWASWQRAWKHYRFSIPSWPEFKKNKLRQVCPDRIEEAHWIRRCEPIFQGTAADTWDHQWDVALWEQNGCAVAPVENLVSNLGAGENATHSKKGDARHNRPLGSVGELIHPLNVTRDPELDLITFDEFYGGRRMRARATFGYQLAKPLRLLRKLYLRP